MAELINKWLVGCDPEFVVMRNGHAVAVKPQDAYGRAAPEVAIAEPFGADHGGRIAEIHPKPARGTWELTKRIKRILTVDPIGVRLREKVGDTWLAGAVVGQECLGGHIHFACPSTPERTAALDRVFKRLEDMEVFPHKDMETRRGMFMQKYGRYDHPDRVREKLYGFEYRVPPSWLYDPKITFLALTVGKIAAADPAGAIAAVDVGATWVKLRGWLEAYKAKDINVRRLLERFWADKPLVGDVKRNIVEVWEGWRG